MGKPAVLETPPPTLVTPETIGQQAATIPVELSTRFLEHFSEQLYSSPQKAFEELISNGWDAGADCVDVRIPTDLAAADATMTVLDNGESMDAAGLAQLWHIAFSPKKSQPIKNGRKIIGSLASENSQRMCLRPGSPIFARQATGRSAGSPWIT